MLVKRRPWADSQEGAEIITLKQTSKGGSKMKLKIATVVFGFFLLFLFGCSDWTVLSPTEGEFTVEVLNVEVTFDYDDQEIILFNKNWNSARVHVSRQQSYSEYLEIVDRRVSGRDEVSKTAYFSGGDRVKITVEVSDENNNEVIRHMYFELGEE